MQQGVKLTRFIFILRTYFSQTAQLEVSITSTDEANFQCIPSITWRKWNLNKNNYKNLHAL